MRLPTVLPRLRASRFPIYRPGPVITQQLDGPARERSWSLREQFHRNPLTAGPTWRLAFRIGALPIKTYDIDPSSAERTENLEHPGYLLLRAPNPTMTRNLLIGWTVGTMLTTRDGYAVWEKERDGNGIVTALWPLPPDVVTPLPDDDEALGDFRIDVGPSADSRTLKREDACYFRLMPGLESLHLGETVTAPLQVIGSVGMAAIDALSDVFEVGLLQRLWVDLNGKNLGDDPDGSAYQRLQARLEQARRVRGSIPIMEDGAELKNAGDSPNDEVMLRAIETSAAIVSRTLGIPEDGDVTKFYGEAVQPIADAIEQELERSLFTEWPDQPAFPQFAFREILKGTPRERIQMHRDAILSMQETPDEARRDEDRGPLPDGAGATAWGPLNLAPVGELVAPDRPEKDSADGLGGDEGKGTLVPVPQAASSVVEIGARASAGVVRSWGKERERILRAQASQLQRRAGKLVRSELRELRAILLRARAAARDHPQAGSLTAELGSIDDELRRLLAGFMDDVGGEGWTRAERLIAAERADVSEALAGAYRERADFVVERFGLHRQEVLERLLEQSVEFSWSERELADAIAQRWGGLADHLVDGIARTETAWAYERAAQASWRAAGITQVQFIFGGGPCTTGVCERAAERESYGMGSPVGNIGYSFSGADSPPLHPNCTCFVIAVPAIGSAA